MNTFVNDRVHVRKRMCKTCIFRPGNLMHLKEGCVDQMVADAGEDGCIPCHSNLDDPINPVCRGFFDKHKNTLLQIAERLDFITYTEDS